MVRKDVKIGAAVVAILIAVLIVYVLVVPGGEPAPNPAGLPTERVSADPAAAPATPAPAVPLDRAAASNAPATVRDGATPVAPAPADRGQTPLASAADPNAAPAPGRTDPFADERWMMALNTGALPQQSRVTGGLPANARPDAPATTPPAGRRPNALTPNPVAGNAALNIDAATRAGAAGMRTHTVQPGENFSRIAENVYGSQVYYKQIVAANPNVNPDKLRPGTVINLPDVKEVKSAGGADDPSPQPSIDPRVEYRVQAGDSLHKIAVKLYGKDELWERLYDLNKARIGDNPAKLKLGMILQLPQPPTQPQ